MSMLAATVVLSVLQADPAGLLVLSRQGLPNDELRKALITVDAELQRAGVVALTAEETSKRLKAAGAAEATSCGGKPACLAALGTRLNTSWLVTVSVTKLGRDRAWVLEAIDVKAGTAGAREEWLDETNGDVSEPAARFAGRLSKSMKPTDAPMVAKLDPPPPPPLDPPLVTATPEPTPSGKVLPKVLLVGAGVAVVGTVVLAIAAASTSNQLGMTTQGPGNVKLSMYTAAEAQALASTANGLTGAAIGAGVIAAGLGVGTALTW
ncbi:MAG: hypothetical protein MUC96_24165 [Myxococcaceae bacterium]|jgi:hypothetical protein|nr:hypothetical protein [Myxococcaceae bacterium]